MVNLSKKSAFVLNGVLILFFVFALWHLSFGGLIHGAIEGKNVKGLIFVIAVTIYSIVVACGLLASKQWVLKSAIIWNIVLVFFVTVPSVLIFLDQRLSGIGQLMLVVKVAGSIVLLWLSSYWWKIGNSQGHS
jgi:hypothetical protein